MMNWWCVFWNMMIKMNTSTLQKPGSYPVSRYVEWCVVWFGWVFSLGQFWSYFRFWPEMDPIRSSGREQLVWRGNSLDAIECKLSFGEKAWLLFKSIPADKKNSNLLIFGNIISYLIFFIIKHRKNIFLFHLRQL